LLFDPQIRKHPPPGSSASVAPRCATHQLFISLGPYSAGAGHIGVPIRFRNEGRTCRMRGYPGVDGLSARGHVVVRAGRLLRGYLGGARRVATITLTARQTAAAFLEGLNFPIGPALSSISRAHDHAAQCDAQRPAPRPLLLLLPHNPSHRCRQDRNAQIDQ
jgi:hypothetical protein